MGPWVRETGRQWALLTAAWCNHMCLPVRDLFLSTGDLAAHPAQSLSGSRAICLLVLLFGGWGRHGDIVARKVVTLRGSWVRGECAGRGGIPGDPA